MIARGRVRVGGVREPLVPQERITQVILLIRGQKVILDEHLAGLYQVETKAINRAVRRNPGRFPEDFVFQLTRKNSPT